MITLLSFLFVLAVLITVHEWGHCRMAAAVGVRVLRFSIGFGKPLLRWTPKRQPLLGGQAQTTEYVIAAWPLGGYVKMLDEREPDLGVIPDSELPFAFNRKPLWARALVVAAGPLANFVLAVLLFAIVNWVGMQLPQARLSSVLPDSAAAQAGLQVDDVVLLVDGETVTDSHQLREWIRNSDQGLPQRWTIERGGVQQVLTVTPRVVEENSDMLGKTKIGKLGAIIGTPKAMVEVRYGLWDGLSDAGRKTLDTSVATLQILGRMVVGEASLKNLSGPLTVAEFSGKTASIGLTPFLLFLGLVSVGLGVLNLLPLPMLDGGHLMYYLWEWVTGKPVSDWWLDKLQRLGFALLILLTALALYNDLIRLFGLTSFFN